MSEPNPYQSPATEVSPPQGNLALEGASVTVSMLEQLKATRPWVRFLSVLGFIGTGFLGLFGVIMAGAAIFGASGEVGGWAAALGIVAYLVVAAVAYLLPTLQLHRYAGAIGRVFSQGGAASIEEALRRQASFWRTAGILVIVGLGLGVLLVLGISVAGVVAAVSGAARR